MKPGLRTARVGSVVAIVMLSILATANRFEAETFPVTGVEGFETGLHNLAFVKLKKKDEVQVAWGDGVTSQGLVRCFEPVLHPFQCHVYGTHVYAEAGTYPVSISYVSPGLFGGRETVTTTATISPVGDFVILSIGDSVASGEGSPVVQFGGARGSAPNQGFWSDQGSNYSFPEPRTPEEAENVRSCHRSSSAGPALAARQAGRTNDVTFVHFACSSATIFGVPRNVSHLDSQLRIARQRLDRIDVLLISGGANHMTFRRRGVLGAHNGEIGIGFGDVILRCLNFFKRPCSQDEEFRQDIHDSIEGNPARTETDNDGSVFRFPGLQRLYADLDKLIRCINPQDDSREAGCHDQHIPGLVLITEYYDPTHDERGEFPGVFNCPEDVSIGPREWEYLYEGVMRRLNHHVGISPWRPVVGIESDFLTHGYCAGGDRWVVRAGESVVRQNDKNGSAHPNEAGQAVYRRRIYDSLVRWNPPVTNASATSNGAPYEFGTVASHDVEVSLAARNPIKESSVGGTLYSINNADCRPAGASGCSTYDGPFVLSTSGTHTINFFSQNGSGALEKLQSVVVKIDRAAAGGCTTTPPDPSWICKDGGWLPPGHPLLGPPPPPRACTTPKPAPDWVCVDGAWVPPDHPLARGKG